MFELSSADENVSLKAFFAQVHKPSLWLFIKGIPQPITLLSFILISHFLPFNEIPVEVHHPILLIVFGWLYLDTDAIP